MKKRAGGRKKRATAGTKRPAKRNRDLTRGYSRPQFAAKLRRLADAVESGRAFTITVAGESMRIPASATFNVEHERSGADEELEFQLLWTATRK
jgi:amphi-Trp domain-containing protein